MRKLTITLISSVVLLGILSCAAYIFYFGAKSKVAADLVDVAYGHSFPSIDVYTSTGEKGDILSIKSRYKVVLCLSSTCHACVEKLGDIRKIIDAFRPEEMAFILMWQDSIPESRINKVGIDMAVNYSLNNKTRLSLSTDFSFILDESGNVIFTTRFGYEALIDKLSDLAGREGLKEKVGLIEDKPGQAVPLKIIKGEYKKCSVISVSAGIKKPQGLVWLNGNILIADSGNNRLLLVDKSGGLIKQIGKTGNGKGEFIAPMGLALDKEQNIYVADSGNYRVQKLGKDGAYLDEIKIEDFKASPLSYIDDVAVDSSDNVYISAYTFDKNLAYIYTASPGKRVKNLGKNLSGHLANTGGKVLFTSELELESSNRSADKPSRRKLLELSGGRIINTCELPDGYIPKCIFAGSSGLYLLDSVAGTLDSFDPNGNFRKTLFQAESAEARGISYLTLDDAGNAYMSDSVENAIYKLER